MIGVLTAAFSAALIIYSLQYVRLSWKIAQAEPRYAAVVKGQLPGEVELDALTRSLRDSPNVSNLSRSAFVQMVRAQQLGIRSIRALPRLTAAQRDLRKGLSAAPTDAYSWTRLAVANAELDEQARAAAALEMALQLAPSDRQLASMQFDLAVMLWNDLSPTARALLAQRLKWASQQPELKTVTSGVSARALKEKLAAKPAG
ncbi:MAG: hypothetical protein ABL973_19840 [Micropepsaceae bacterium]